jgi:hypothetical protein
MRGSYGTWDTAPPWLYPSWTATRQCGCPPAGTSAPGKGSSDRHLLLVHQAPDALNPLLAMRRKLLRSLHQGLGLVDVRDAIIRWLQPGGDRLQLPPPWRLCAA